MVQAKTNFKNVTIELGNGRLSLAQVKSVKVEKIMNSCWQCNSPFDGKGKVCKNCESYVLIEAEEYERQIVGEGWGE